MTESSVDNLGWSFFLQVTGKWNFRMERVSNTVKQPRTFALMRVSPKIPVMQQNSALPGSQKYTQHKPSTVPCVSNFHKLSINWNLIVIEVLLQFYFGHWQFSGFDCVFETQAQPIHSLYIVTTPSSAY